MNEQIQKLADSCWEEEFHWGLDGPMTINRFNYERFAKLVVQECVRVVEDNEWYIAATELKERFGVDK